MSTKEFADRAKVGVNKARGLLKELVAADLAGTWKDGRTMRYWARSRGTRPDLGLGAQINALVPRVDRVAAAQAGKRLARSKLLGFIGDDERLSDLVLVYQPVFRLTFEETVQRGLLGRLFGPSHDLRLGNIYLHPCTLQVLVFHSDRGIRFADKPADLASEVADFDGSITFTERAPGELTLDEERWRDRRSSKEVRAHFKRRFEASPKSIENVFVPVWKLLLENAEGGDYRVQLIDALVGEPVQWP